MFVRMCVFMYVYCNELVAAISPAETVNIYVYIYICIYRVLCMCVCMCVCACVCGCV